MTRLSVNINKVALLRNARGSNFPNLLQFAQDCEHYGAQGITVHPRPDERHVRFSDLQPLKEIVQNEFNIEGYPSEHFMKAVAALKPHQCTLVPDAPDSLTSDNGWDTINRQSELRDIVARLQDQGIRVSLFLNPKIDLVDAAKETGTDRIEFYTGPYALNYNTDRLQAVADYKAASVRAAEIGLGINAGHDLNLDNLTYFKQEVTDLQEVSVGHALVVDSLYYGLSSTIQMYLQRLKN